jgi:hypothetical protein
MAGKKVDNPKYRVLSGRVSEEEYAEFQGIAAKIGTTLSNMVREVMIDWKKRRTP